MQVFFQYFGLGLSSGFALAFGFHYVGKTIRRSFGLVGRSLLMR